MMFPGLAPQDSCAAFVQYSLLRDLGCLQVHGGKLLPHLEMALVSIRGACYH